MDGSNTQPFQQDI